ncbi:hypothetical protein DSD19_20965 [Rhodovulum sp. BSW8]|uniref:Uncharacterized protein n=1 Tax=Rhodovulum visakhapatnamense TaxID=364297 RepID=A0A4R8FJ42_9RHOB|nr:MULTISPECIES: hypothetical protein [Rhodovulum]OLS43491.1 hypothetical protein BV509_03560 [Rhodovulum sulfidophilum]MBL3570719.1 hypothetical protein [Rhodovulum visakhapatnamense]MBL3578573.1 hypothetical protein [Rhodovulum visakhapatnamense]RBO51297.1 hypothetical protein DSD19_20965 [Rhodovulum sp. BSW8]TDX26129.1 hypothetical protein EV657_11846 [Rhodovulum visakhapatnamense]
MPDRASRTPARRSCPGSCRSLCALPPARALPILAVALGASAFLWLGLGAGLGRLAAGADSSPVLAEFCVLGIQGFGICALALALLIGLARPPRASRN